MTKRQAIIEALKARFQTIRTAAGYYTDLGLKVYEWKPTRFEVELGAVACSIRDPGENQDQQPSSIHTRTLTVEVDVVAGAGVSTASVLRQCIGDLEKAIGTDRSFGGLAFDSRLESDAMKIEQEDRVKGFATVRLQILYRTQAFNPDA